MGPIAKAIFLDTPSVIDSAWRHLDYSWNRERYYRYDAAPHILPRPFWHKPPFWFFVVTLLFVSYGPTWDGLCATLPRKFTDPLRWALAAAVFAASLYLAYRAACALWNIVSHRFKRIVANELTKGRKATVIIIAAIPPILLIATGVFVAYFLYEPGDTACFIENGSGLALTRFLLCLAAVAVFVLIARSPRVTVDRFLWAQAGILVAVAAIQWIVLTHPESREAEDVPYRHLFELLAPCIVLILALAPWLARRAFASVPAATGARFQRLLTERELFVQPPEPDASWGRVWYAFVYGPAYHLLHLLLLPALVALVTPAKWLYPFVFGTFVFSVFLLVWGNVSSRWQQLNTYIERWFLRGTPLLISSLVILVGVLRVAQFDYVSTILDAAPFGFVFGLVVMNYVLFWLVEYWMSRAAASQLLHVLGGGADQIAIPYQPDFDQTQNGVRVVRQNRFLLSHDTGRFIVVGTVGNLGPRGGQGQPVTPLIPAFQSYYLTELFERLGENTGDPHDHDKVMEISRRTGIYFFLMNSMIAAVIAVFAGVFIYEEYVADNAIDPVVISSTTPPEHPVDLAKLLQEDSGRPAIVVVGSGGGTRAALYTASVLNGLHRLGVDRDIVLVSGVSGGGVALAYFAANYDALTAPSPARSAGKCPDDKSDWDCFNKGVTKPFIEDVLNGATEWRLLRTTPLSALLVESFQRYLFTSQQRLGSVDRVALILNSAMVSHPDIESEVLTQTIDKAETPRKCDDAERTYKLMGGGRLIFTNLQDVEKFPKPPEQEKPPVPDVRLPYQIVRDARVPLAAAGALNANFPPVFANARVRFDGTWPNRCNQRSYYVTDGGAEENLGLVSALYAIESALAKIPKNAVRPIHIVIAEASAVSYDYRQDYGLSAVFGGSKERLTGGLTNELINKINSQLCRRANLDDQHCPRPSENPNFRFHYLALPLAFRARGGFGTHWMYAKEYHLSDPRPRTTPLSDYLPFDWLRESKVTVKRKELEGVWAALHDPGPKPRDPDPKKPFCNPNSFPRGSSGASVQSWICGSASDPTGRDLHLEEWNNLVRAMDQYPNP
jgi:hypothetical protein